MFNGLYDWSDQWFVSLDGQLDADHLDEPAEVTVDLEEFHLLERPDKVPG